MNTKNIKIDEGSSEQASYAGQKAEPVTTEMLEFLEANWNHTQCVDTIFKEVCKNLEETEANAAQEIIEQLLNRKKISNFAVACIAGNIASKSYDRGHRYGLKLD